MGLAFGPRKLCYSMLSQQYFPSCLFAFNQIKPEPEASKTFEYFPYFAYAPNGTVEGELVYINKGGWKDMEYLLDRNISLKGKVVIVRSMFSSVIIKLLLFDVFHSTFSLRLSPGYKNCIAILQKDFRHHHFNVEGCRKAF